MDRYTEAPDIAPADWIARQQGIEDARVAVIRRNLGKPVGSAPTVVAGSEDERREPQHKHKWGSAVISDRGEKYASAADAAFAIGLNSTGHVYQSIAKGTTAGGRHWSFCDEKVPALGRARKLRKTRPVVSEFGERFPSVASAARRLGMSNGGYLSQSIQRGWRVNGVMWHYADSEAA